MGKAWRFTVQLYRKSSSDNVLFMAAVIAYNLLFTAIPLILVVLSLLGYVLSAAPLTETGPVASYEEARRRTVELVQQLIPVGSEQILQNVNSIVRDRTLLAVLGLLGTMFSATRLVGALRGVLDRVFELGPGRSTIGGKLFDLAVVFIFGLSFIAVHLLFTFLPDYYRQLLIVGWLDRTLPWSIGSIIEPLLTILVTALFLYASYRFLPVRRVERRTALLATGLALALIKLSQYGYQYFLGHVMDFNRIYGTMVVVAGLLIWFYIAAWAYVIAAEVACITEGRCRVYK